jgi:hypothetical protein
MHTKFERAFGTEVTLHREAVRQAVNLFSRHRRQ